MCADIADRVTADILQMSALSGEEILQNRYRRFRKIGVYTEE
jgi:acetyl-CoA carboxylase alpha subunit